ncbi:uncharacterized protein ARMOST_00553 [Armillaria ostoyae]|uniref:Uncharacterized protein n=1 Tax=Armillaria ostoyae TaxID=47428 RepID=A0A284QLG3_ARMOS|nr:uncharacterized protein ARMOST_00553 [Armillaria ostoyae]
MVFSGFLPSARGPDSLTRRAVGGHSSVERWVRQALNVNKEESSAYGSGSSTSSSPEAHNVPDTDSFVDISMFVRSEIINNEDFLIGVGMVVAGGKGEEGWDLIGSDRAAVNDGQRNDERRMKDRVTEEDLG